MPRAAAQVELANAIGEMRLRIRRAWRDWDNAPEQLRFRGVRLQVQIPPIDLFDWLNGQRYPRQILWSSRDGQLQVAGVGLCNELRASSIESPETLLQRGRELLAGFGSLKPRYFGGFAFSNRSVEEPPWLDMGLSRFWIPRAELLREGSKYFLACNLLFRRSVEQDLTTLLHEWEGVTASLKPAAQLPPLTTRRDLPDREGWESNVLAALDLIENGVLDKVVLARKARYSFADEVPAAAILNVLRGVTSNCYHFLLQPQQGFAFMGTTPERLFWRKGRELKTEALAGTRPRSEDPEEDQRLADELLNERKDLHEQELVRRDILRALHLVCDRVDAEERPSLLQLERKQHLISRIQGHLQEGQGDGELLQLLHPTPAVGGSPRENALRELERLEPFSRGWYAGPLGWFSEDEAEFSVAIRSGLVQGRDVSVYSGAGIVSGSDPAKEWQEIENKISDFVKVTSPGGWRPSNPSL